MDEKIANTTPTGFYSAVTTTTTLIPITKIITASSRTTNYEIPGDDTSYDLTQPTITSEPYFDAQTPRNVTGLVGKGAIDIWDNSPIFCFSHHDVQKPQLRPGESFVDNAFVSFFLSPVDEFRKICLSELSRPKFGEQNGFLDSTSRHSHPNRRQLYIHE